MCYNYKGVLVPPIGMVDYIKTLTDVTETGGMNELINTFMESKKLGLSKDKCYRIHIGKRYEDCLDLAVHDSKMKEAEKENPAYWRYQLSRPMRIVGPIQI